MQLIYLDESGNSGNNLNDPQQPIFLLCAMILSENKWLSLEKELSRIVDKHLFLESREEGFEIHGTEIRSGNGPFKGKGVAERIAFRNEWMDAAAAHDVKLIYRAIEKKRYQQWLHATFGTAVSINPHVAAFALVSRVVDDYLKTLPGSPLGMFISDENKEIVADVEKSIRVLRGVDSPLRLGQIIEKGFFIDSASSLPLQMCDLFALSLRKQEEAKIGLPAKPVDQSGIQRALSLVHHGNEATADVLAWLKQQRQRKKEATGG